MKIDQSVIWVANVAIYSDDSSVNGFSTGMSSSVALRKSGAREGTESAIDDARCVSTCFGRVWSMSDILHAYHPNGTFFSSRG